MTSAMDENDICLHGIPIEVDESVAELISKQKGSDIFSAKTSATKKKDSGYPVAELHARKQKTIPQTKKRAKEPETRKLKNKYSENI